MTPEEHKQKHVELHNNFFELLDDYIQYHPEKISGNTILFNNINFKFFVEWSFEQSRKPSELKHIKSAQD